MRFTNSIFAILVTLLSSISFAEAKFILDRSSISSWEAEQYGKFINEVHQLLPTVVKENIPSLTIRFVTLSNGKSLHDLDLICAGNGGRLPLGQAADFKMFSPSTKEIHLSELLWAEILKGPQNSFNYNCGHKTGYRLALATLIHEIGHYYDYAKWVSKDRRFLHLTTFNSGVITTQKNKDPMRSPDLNEILDPKEAFAVNFEFFLVDPEYKCRRPALYEYYREKLQHAPKPSNCQLSTHNIVQGLSRRLMDLDPKRLYRVDYLLASEGTQFGSWFGHSMLRLVFCAPLTPLSEQCANQTMHHVVVSFRASATDDKKSNEEEQRESILDKIAFGFKGLGIVASFPSKLFLLSMPLVVAEYGDLEFRDVVAVPLRLSNEEKRNLLYRVLEITYGYSGSYKFLTNNCKTETEDLLKAIIQDKRVDEIGALTPVELRKELYRLGLADQSKEMVYQSMHRYLLEASGKIKQIFAAHGMPRRGYEVARHLATADFKNRDAILRYFNEFSADDRRIFILGVKEVFESKDPTIYRDVLGSILTFEGVAILYQKVSQYMQSSNAKQIIVNRPSEAGGISDQEGYAELLQKLEASKATSKFINENKEELNQGYGVPLRADYSQPNQTLSKLGELHPSIDKKVDEIIDILLTDQKIGLETTSENIRLIRALAATLLTK